MAGGERWLSNHRVTTLWSGPDEGAIGFTEVPQFSYFKQLGPQVKSRIFVHYFGNSTSQAGDIWVDAEDLGPIGGRPDGPEPERRYAPKVLIKPDVRAGTFQQMPKGVILHGSRSGIEGNSTHNEFMGTANFALNTDLGWNATIGDDEIALHLGPDEWGWNARAASLVYLGVEIAQPTHGAPITDGQVRAFCWWMRRLVLPTWPGLPLHFPTHSEVEHNGETGQFDGKSDVFKWQDQSQCNELRQRIFARLADNSWMV